MNFREIDLVKDRDLLFKFRKDVHLISFENLTGFGEDEYLKRLRSRIKAFSEGQLFVEENGCPVGQLGFFITEYEGETIGYVNLLYITKEFRGRGFGYKLINYAEAYFKRNSIKEYHLRVSPVNERAYKFYVKVGMTKLIEEDVGHIVWRMRKELSTDLRTVAEQEQNI